MISSPKTIAGILFFVAATQFILALTIAETGYPGYSIANNYISDLGIGPSALVFNISVILLGLFTLTATYYLHKTFTVKLETILLVVAALATMGVGIFTENSEPFHDIFSVIVFSFGGLAVLASSRMLHRPLSIISIILGLLILITLPLYIGGFYAGLGSGGMERIIVYPLLIWMIGFSSFLMTTPKST